MAIDDDSGTRWATDDSVRGVLARNRFRREPHVRRRLSQRGLGPGEGIRLETQDARGTWRPFYKGTTIGTAGLSIAFPKTTGRKVRLHILKSEGGPTIWDFELYEAAPFPPKF